MTGCRIDVGLNWHPPVFLSRHRVVVRCEVELAPSSLPASNAGPCRSFLLPFNSLVEQVVDPVKHLHSRLLTRRAGGRVRVGPSYCLNAANGEAPPFTAVGYLSPCRGRIGAVMGASPRTKGPKSLRTQ